MFKEFKGFLTKSNALALAVGVIIGAATGKVVTAISDDLLMPIIGLLLPGGDWRQAKLVLHSTVDAQGKVIESAILYGNLAGAFVDFLIIAFIVFVIMRLFIREPAPVPSKVCPQCLESIAVGAHRCKFCTSAV